MCMCMCLLMYHPCACACSCTCDWAQDSWLDMVSQIPRESPLHGLLLELLVAQPEALNSDPHRVAAVADTILHATLKQRLYRCVSSVPLTSQHSRPSCRSLLPVTTPLQWAGSHAVPGSSQFSIIITTCTPPVPHPCCPPALHLCSPLVRAPLQRVELPSRGAVGSGSGLAAGAAAGSHRCTPGSRFSRSRRPG